MQSVFDSNNDGNFLVFFGLCSLRRTMAQTHKTEKWLNSKGKGYVYVKHHTHVADWLLVSAHASLRSGRKAKAGGYLQCL